MKTYLLRTAPAEVVRLLRAETAAAEGQPELYLEGRQDFLIEEDFDRCAYGLTDGSRYDLVTAEAELTVEPRVERDDWMLSLVYSKDLGPQLTEDENAFFGGELTLDEFDTRFLAPGDAVVTVHLAVQTPEAKRHFDHWWADLNARHPREAPAPVPRPRPRAAASRMIRACNTLHSPRQT
jgi:hypothetical protein